MNEDKRIWEDFKKGHNDALSHIYFDNVQLLYRIGGKYTKNSELVKDTIQDLFYDLIRTRKNLSTTDNIRFYLITSFRRLLFRNLKKKDNQMNLSSEYELNAEIVYSAEELFILREDLTYREKLIQQGLSEISPKQREIIFYRYICDLDYDQICNIMSLKYDSARKQLTRAIKSLKDKLSQKNNFLLFTILFRKKSSLKK